MQQALSGSLIFRQWAVLTHRSQNDDVGLDRSHDAPHGTRRDAPSALIACGRRAPRSLELDPALPIPPPIGNTEIHRQPGGFHGAADPDLTPGLRYIGASQIYAPGKGNFEAAGDDRGAALARQVRARFPDLQPTRILDLGCGIGLHAQSVARAFQTPSITRWMSLRACCASRTCWLKIAASRFISTSVMRRGLDSQTAIST